MARNFFWRVYIEALTNNNKKFARVHVSCMISRCTRNRSFSNRKSIPWCFVARYRNHWVQCVGSCWSRPRHRCGHWVFIFWAGDHRIILICWNIIHFRYLIYNETKMKVWCTWIVNLQKKTFFRITCNMIFKLNFPCLILLSSIFLSVFDVSENRARFLSILWRKRLLPQFPRRRFCKLAWTKTFWLNGDIIVQFKNYIK